MDLELISKMIITFVQEHRLWAAPLVLGLAFCESLAFISLVLPFWTLLIAIGTLFNATGSVDFWLIVGAATIGAALGDWLSYWLGYHYHEQIARMWPLNRFPDLLPAGRRFFDKWGAWAILFGRFSGPLRASIPIIAGTVRMPATTFQFANWGSAVVWAFSLMLFGDALGKAWTWAHSHAGG